MIHFICDNVLKFTANPPRPWYGSDFSPATLPYSSVASNTLSITHPSTPSNVASEHLFWESHIPEYSSRFLDPNSRDSVDEDSSIGHIDSLPFEVLRNIVEEAAHTSPLFPEPEGELRERPMSGCRLDLNPLLLGQVCPLWRNIVRTIPQLWSTIRLYGPNRAQARLAELYLIRSGPSTPLTLSLEQSWIASPFPCALSAQERSVYHILDLFVQQIHRWRGINFKLLAGDEGSPLLRPDKVFPGAAKILEVAHVDLKDWETQSKHRLWQSLSSSPVLKDISWGHLRPMPPSTPWTRLTHLQLTDVYPDTLFQMLPLLQELEALKCHLPQSFSSTHLPEEPTVLPKLHTLDFAPCEMPDILGYISAPALRKIQIRHPSYVQHMDAVRFHNFLSRSKCTITSFTLSAPSCGAGHQQHAILKYLSTDRLEQVEVMRIKATIGDMIIVVLDAGIFGSLRELMLSECETSDGFVGSMVQQRVLGDPLSGIGPIEVIRIGFVGKRHVIDGAKLEVLQRRGFKLEMTA